MPKKASPVPQLKQDFATQLYQLIRKRVKRSYIVRRLATVDDVAADIFLLLVERKLPPLESEEFENQLTKAVNQTVRQLIRNDKEMLDVDELGESEHPFYETNFYSDEEEFEFVFSKFCESFADPQRTVFRQSRLLSKRDIAALMGISRNEVARIIKAMPELFQEYITKNYGSV